MLEVVKAIVRDTWPFREYERRRALRDLRGWTPADDRMRDFYARLAPAGGLVFDVGANMGNRTKVFLAMGCRVVAVEPQPRCAAVLRRAFANEPGLIVVEEALGSAPGRAELMAGPSHTLASLNAHWVRAVTESGRFAAERWNRKIPVAVTTLDHLIAEHGTPDFVKIDVEGFELEVLRGLSGRVGGVSLEFAPEFMEHILACLKRLDGIGLGSFALSLGESLVIEPPGWQGIEEMRDHLRHYAGRWDVFGDIYARPASPG